MKKYKTSFSLALAGGIAALLPLGSPAQTAVQIAATGAPSELAATPAPDAAGKAPSASPEITETDIEASISATFNSKDHVAVFNGNVKVVDPRFQLVCDKLTVFLNKPAPTTAPSAAGGKPASKPPTPAGAPGGNGGGGGGGIDHALAEGHVVIIQKKGPPKPGEEEQLSIGRGQTATFDNKTGDMVLKGWPSLEQNGSSVVAASAATVMTITRDGNMHADGPIKTHLIGRGKSSTLDLPGAPNLDKSPSGGRRGGGGR